MSSNIRRGGGESLYIMNGCSNHSEHDRAMFDYYATDPKAAEWLLKIEPDLSDNIWECACGEHALSLVDEGRYVCMFLRLSFLEGKERRKFYDKYPPIRVWVSSLT